MACLALAGAGCADPKGNDPNVADFAGAVSLDATAASGCPRVLPSSCPVTPSYANDVEPIVKRSCVPCHAPGQVAADRNLTTYAGVNRLEATVLVQVNGCLMPPADAGPDAALSTSDRTELLQWLVCGAPDN